MRRNEQLCGTNKPIIQLFFFTGLRNFVLIMFRKCTNNLESLASSVSKLHVNTSDNETIKAEKLAGRL